MKLALGTLILGFLVLFGGTARAEGIDHSHLFTELSLANDVPTLQSAGLSAELLDFDSYRHGSTVLRFWADFWRDVDSNDPSIPNTATSSSTTTPEPSTLALLGVGLFGFGLARKRSALRGSL